MANQFAHIQINHFDYKSFGTYLVVFNVDHVIKETFEDKPHSHEEEQKVLKSLMDTLIKEELETLDKTVYKKRALLATYSNNALGYIR